MITRDYRNYVNSRDPQKIVAEGGNGAKIYGSPVVLACPLNRLFQGCVLPPEEIANFFGRSFKSMAVIPLR